MEYKWDTICNCCARNNHQRLGKGNVRGWVRNQRTSGDYPDYDIIKIGQNHEKSPGYLRRISVPKTPVEPII